MNTILHENNLASQFCISLAQKRKTSKSKKMQRISPVFNIKIITFHRLNSVSISATIPPSILAVTPSAKTLPKPVKNLHTFSVTQTHETQTMGRRSRVSVLNYYIIISLYHYIIISLYYYIIILLYY